MNRFEMKIARKLLGLTQIELGVLIGVNYSTIAKYEKGARKITEENQIKLANVFFAYGIGRSELEMLRYLLSITSGIKGGKNNAGNEKSRL